MNHRARLLIAYLAIAGWVIGAFAIAASIFYFTLAAPCELALVPRGSTVSQCAPSGLVLGTVIALVVSVVFYLVVGHNVVFLKNCEMGFTKLDLDYTREDIGSTRE